MQREEDLIEAAYWKYDTLKKRKGRPMEERDAYKASVREMLSQLLQGTRT